MTFFAFSRHEPLVLRSHTELVAECERLTVENGHLQRALASHVVVDQAMGVVVALGQIPPEEAWRVLRDVSQRTNTKLRTVAEHVLAFPGGVPLPEHERLELDRAIARYRGARSLLPPHRVEADRETADRDT